MILPQILGAVAGGVASPLTAAVDELLTALFTLARRSMEANVWMGVARCLGELGAIDPSRVSVTIHAEQVPIICVGLVTVVLTVIRR